MFQSASVWIRFSDVRGALLMSAAVVVFLNNAYVSWCVAICRPFFLHRHPIRCQHCLSVGDGQVGVFTQCLWILTKDWYYSKPTLRHFFFLFFRIFCHIRAHVHIKFLCHDKMIIVASGCFITQSVEPFTLDAKQTFSNLFHSSLLHLVYPNLSHPFTFIAVIFKHAFVFCPPSLLPRYSIL